jgi:DNA polymerase
MNINNTFCKKCKLYKKVNSPCIEGRGNPSAPILLLGEGPGETEDRQAQVFVGRS